MLHRSVVFFRVAGWVAAAALATSAWGSADGADSAASPPPPAYVLVAGDVLEITVEPHTGYDRTVPLQPDGKIVFPVVGELVAAGLTLQQLTERIEQGLRVELKRPRVTVSLKEINKGLLRRVSILGAVKNEGVYELRDRSSLPELLATAGGATPLADLRRVTVTRPDGSRKRVVDLSGAARTGDVTSSVTLEAGDLILVPEGVAPTVAVLGEVARAGNYELKGETRLLDALSLAGGPTPKADLRRVLLTRAGQAGARALDAQALFTPGVAERSDANIVLLPGDTLILPENPRKYYVLGEVNRPESYPLKPDDGLLDALTTAGGSTREADLGRVTLVRKNAQGQLIARPIDLRAMMKKGTVVRNEPLQEGDVIFIPNRKRERSLLDYLGALYPISGLLGVLR